MKVIICGAGQVGFNIARLLSAEGNDVTVIDQEPNRINRVAMALDVQAIVGFASHPDVLDQAGARDADMLIAVTREDEINMVACQISHSLFNVPLKVARIREQNYMKPEWSDLFSRDHLPIDVIISPEIEVARAIARRLEVPGAFDVIPLAEGKVKLIGLHCLEDCPVVNTRLLQLTELFPDLHITLVGIVRNEALIVPTENDQMLAGDDVYFTVESTHVARAMVAFGHEEPEARRVGIIGGGNVAYFLAKEIEEQHPAMHLKVIEFDRHRAEMLAERLNRTVVLHGDALDLQLLDEMNVRATEAVIAVTNDDEVNILSSLLSKRQGCPRAIAIVNNETYGMLVGWLGIDAVVSPRLITVSSILQHVRRGRIRGVHSIHEGAGEIIEADALETSPLVGKPLREVNLPDGVVIGAIVRGEEVLIPRGGTMITTGDRVILFALADAVKKVEKLFTVGLEFF
ncbi:MAG: Trk system potassium transporter TrkA [Alphaproteobacteria bacterium]